VSEDTGEPSPLTVEGLDRLEHAIRHCAGDSGPLDETVFRFARMARANRRDLLGGIGGAMHGGRWNPRGVRAVYTSLDELTAVAETFEASRANGLPISEATPSVIAAIRVSLGRVLDLTGVVASGVLDPLGFTAGRMAREPWRGRLDSAEPCLTIEIGRISHGLGVQAIVVPSKPRPGGKNLVIFVDHCPPGSLRIINEGDLPAPGP